VAYDTEFLSGSTIPLPELLPGTIAQALNAGTPIDHTHHSIVLNESRQLAIYVAHNLRGDRVEEIKRRSFKLDPTVARSVQLTNTRGYFKNPWDRGHLARRLDVHWPDAATAKQAELETAYWTNIAPQHKTLNNGPWRKIEDWLLDLADAGSKRLSVFTGPVFTATDLRWVPESGDPVLIPAGYWKVAALVHGGAVKAAAFLIWQNDVHPDVDDFDPKAFDPVLEQVRVTTIEHLAGLSFGDLVRSADPLRFGAVQVVGVGTAAGPVGDPTLTGTAGIGSPGAASVVVTAVVATAVPVAGKDNIRL